MDIVKIDHKNCEYVGELAAEFRVVLKSFKGIQAKANIPAGKEEIQEYLASGFPIFAALCDGKYAGYIVLRVDEPCVWVESIYTRAEYRRNGVASALLAKAEAIAKSYGEETVYHYVHPNNCNMINFLRKHGYTVLNLIEIRKPYPEETLRQIIHVDDYEFDY